MSEEEKWRNVVEYQGDKKLKLGPYFTFNLLHSPKHLLFTFSRYKFAARLIGEEPKIKILELGCNEGLGTLFLAESGHNVTGVDFDKKAIQWAKTSIGKKDSLIFKCDNFIGKKYGKYDAVVSIDVVEHILKKQEKDFFQTIINNLTKDGFCIIGTPNISTSKYSSKQSKLGHVNLFSAERLRDTMRKYFKNVFIFGMNDEVAHTGFYPMSHYLFALGVNPRS